MCAILAAIIFMFPARLIPLSLLILAFLLPFKAGAQIYADVQVAGAVSGTFTITLEHQKTPGTVANFIGLATGQRGWLDLTTGAIRHDGFYNGVTFHRVIKNFMSQTGSRNGLGTDGPGYTFRDEIDGTLSHVNYAVAMANSGRNTNGSQFYICRGPQTGLDGGYTIFGLVTAGHAVCDAINDTPVTGSTPVVPITIQSVNIHGPSLAAFNLDPAWLPKVRDAKPVLQKTGATFTLGFERLPFSEYRIFHGTNLANWVVPAGTYFGDAAPVSDTDITAIATGTEHFYRMPRIDYATCAFPDIVGNTFTFSNPLGGTAALNATRTGGTWTFAGGSPIALIAASYIPKPYAPQLFLHLSNGFQFLLNLNRTSATAGGYAGQTNVNGFPNVSGTYTVAP